MRARIAVVAVLVLGAARGPAPLAGQHGHGHEADSLEAGPRPYAGLQTREIKALSSEEIRGLETGEGLGMALAAELNGLPGPKHALELADALELTGSQRAAVEQVEARMHDAAVALGHRVIAAERELDRALAEGTPTEAEIRRRTLEIGRLRGELRGVHLAAHLETAAVLDGAQRARYGHLRGYGDEGEGTHEGHGGDPPAPPPGRQGAKTRSSTSG